MATVNKYAHRSKISEAKFRQLVKLFAIDLDASQIAEVTGLNRNTVNRYLMALRRRVAEFCEQQAPVLGEVEIDESYFGPRRVKGLRGRGASCKTIVFGIFKRQGRVYTEIVPDCSRATLQAVIRGRVLGDEQNPGSGRGGLEIRVQVDDHPAASFLAAVELVVELPMFRVA